MRQRVARHLLDLAVRESEGLVVYASHQNIADAIGSVREVVSRVLRELRADGLVDRAGERIILRRPTELHRLVAEVHRAAR
jgi:CRP-like cAMP-binding protein